MTAAAVEEQGLLVSSSEAGASWEDFVEGGQIRVSYESRLIPLGQLFVDYHEDLLNGAGPGVQGSKALMYQRHQDKIAKRMIRDGIKADLFGALIVNQREDDLYAVVDGGTRYRALHGLATPADVGVPCLVFQWDPEEEIRNYVDLNQERSGLTQVDIFVAKVKYGDETATAIQKVLVEETGHGVGYKKGNWQCVNALQVAHRRGNLYRALVMMRQLGWLEMPRGKTQTMIGALDRLLQLGADPDVALTRWAGLTPAGLYNEAKEHNSVVGSRSIAKTVALKLGTVYNHKKRSGRIDLLRLSPKGEDDDDE
jgi:hypothetical protein